jgi:hypothetical protein
MEKHEFEDLSIEPYLAQLDESAEKFAKFNAKNGLKICIYDQANVLKNIAFIPKRNEGIDPYEELYILKFNGKKYLFDHLHLVDCSTRKVIGLKTNNNRQNTGIEALTSEAVFVKTRKKFYPKTIHYPKLEYEEQITQLYDSRQYDLIMAISSEAFQLH